MARPKSIPRPLLNGLFDDVGGPVLSKTSKSKLRNYLSELSDDHFKIDVALAAIDKSLREFLNRADRFEKIPRQSAQRDREQRVLKSIAKLQRDLSILRSDSIRRIEGVGGNKNLLKRANSCLSQLASVLATKDRPQSKNLRPTAEKDPIRSVFEFLVRDMVKHWQSLTNKEIGRSTKKGSAFDLVQTVFAYVPRLSERRYSKHMYIIRRLSETSAKKNRQQSVKTRRST